MCLELRIQIWTGQEIFYSNSVIRLLEEDKLLTLADSNYVLIEFMPAVPYFEICTAVQNLSRTRYVPVIAHAERYRCLRKGKRLEELIGLDALIQMNYRSVGGSWHDVTARWCRDNLKKGNISKKLPYGVVFTIGAFIFYLLCVNSEGVFMNLLFLSMLGEWKTEMC